MIPISLTTALALYSGVLLLLAVLIWVVTEIREQRTHTALEKQYLWRCVFCAYTYLDEAASTVSQCPRCGSYNAQDDKHARFVKPRSRVASGPATRGEEQPRRNPSRGKRPHTRHRGPRRRR